MPYATQRGIPQDAGEADSLGSARSYADPARERLCGWHCAGRGGEPTTLRRRLPSLRARSICACRCCIYYGAHRITFGAGPVRRVLHADSATCSANNNFQARLGLPI